MYPPQGRAPGMASERPRRAGRTIEALARSTKESTRVFGIPTTRVLTLTADYFTGATAPAALSSCSATAMFSKAFVTSGLFTFALSMTFLALSK